MYLPVSAFAGFYYQVKPNDTIDSIARRYRISAYQIAKENRISVNVALNPGTRIWVPASASTAPPPESRAAARPAPSPRSASPRSASRQPSSYKVRKGDSLWGIAKRHGVTVDALSSVNGIRDPGSLEVGQVLIIPDPSAVTTQSTTYAKAQSRPGGGDFRSSTMRTTGGVSSRGYSWPVEGEVIQRFQDSSSSKHTGIDVAVAYGTNVRAARDGEVLYAGSSISAYGKMVIIKHSNGYATCYAYNADLKVRVGERVSRGEVIATSGDSGKLSRPALHFQLRNPAGDAIDPIPYLP